VKKNVKQQKRKRKKKRRSRTILYYIKVGLLDCKTSLGCVLGYIELDQNNLDVMEMINLYYIYCILLYYALVMFIFCLYNVILLMLCCIINL